MPVILDKSSNFLLIDLVKEYEYQGKALPFTEKRV